MKTIKTPRYNHNRPCHGSWNYDNKDERKQRRKLFKSVRHKLLMKIPLTVEEEKFKILNNINEKSKMTFDGYSTY